MPGVLDSYKVAAAKVGFDKSSDFKSNYVIDAQNCVALVNMTTETILETLFWFQQYAYFASTVFVLPFSRIFVVQFKERKRRVVEEEVDQAPGRRQGDKEKR